MGKDRIPTIHFQGRAVSFREGIIFRYSFLKCLLFPTTFTNQCFYCCSMQPTLPPGSNKNLTSPLIRRKLQHAPGYLRPESPRVYVSELLSLGVFCSAKLVCFWGVCWSFLRLIPSTQDNLWEKNKVTALVKPGWSTNIAPSILIGVDPRKIIRVKNGKDGSFHFREIVSYIMIIMYYTSYIGQIGWTSHPGFLGVKSRDSWPLNFLHGIPQPTGPD